MVVEYLAALNTSIELVKRLKDISKDIKNAEFKHMLAELYNELGDVKLEMANLKEQNANLLVENQELKAARSDEKEVPTVKWGFYQFNGEGAFCTGCYDLKGMKVRMNYIDHRNMKCPSCKSVLFIR